MEKKVKIFKRFQYLAKGGKVLWTKWFLLEELSKEEVRERIKSLDKIQYKTSRIKLLNEYKHD